MTDKLEKIDELITTDPDALMEMDLSDSPEEVRTYTLDGKEI